jgi:hypothetical protein
VDGTDSGFLYVDPSGDTTMKRWFRVLPLTLIMASLAGCSGRSIEIGPIRVTAPLGEGTLLADMFSSKGLVPITRTEDLCNLPTEEQLQESVLQAGNINLSDFVRLSRLEVVETTFTATSGDFNFVSEVSVRYIPAPIDGVDQDPVELGSASNPNGLGTIITLVPPETVDLLDLIRANDDNPSDECPQLEIVATARTVPSQDVTFTIDTTIDAFARVGIQSGSN